MGALNATKHIDIIPSLWCVDITLSAAVRLNEFIIPAGDYGKEGASAPQVPEENIDAKLRRFRPG